MPSNADENILENDFVQVEFAEIDDVLLHPNNDMMANRQHVDCISEKTFWKYARSILYLNSIISPFRAIMYMLICGFRLLFCEYKKSKDAAGEVFKSILVLFAALAAVAVTDDFVEISNCIAEVLFEFVIGGLTLQICLGLGDALINCVLNCTDADLTIEKIVESILEPIVFFGGFFSIYLYFKRDKHTAKSQHAKYSAIGNLLGSTIAVALASYLCFRIEAKSHNVVNVYNTPAPIIEVDSQFGKPEFHRDVVNLYNTKNSVLAMNVLARIFAEGIAKCVEHKYNKKVLS